MNEFERIDAFVAQFDRVPTPFGPGDDAAVLPAAAQSCVTTDAVVEGVHFTRETSSLEDIGHKALAVNLSDLAAMGATPSWAVCALGLPERFTPTQLRALGRGMAALARVHGVALVGGNVTASPVLTVTLTVAGTVRHPMLRSGAQAGDALYLSGPLGLASAGLQALFTKQSAGFERLKEAQRRPQPHLAWAQAAARFASAGIDVSDGLAQDLGHLARASGVRIEIDTSLMPLDAALTAWAGSRPAALEHALTGGEDYVLAVTVPARRAKAFEAAMRHFEVSRIGAVARGIGVLVDGKVWRRPGGFQHFT